ncbi:unnamed protein product, partial [Ectocarpus sp. 12 AP-2014]
MYVFVRISLNYLETRGFVHGARAAAGGSSSTKGPSAHRPWLVRRWRRWRRWCWWRRQLRRRLSGHLAEQRQSRLADRHAQSMLLLLHGQPLHVCELEPPHVLRTGLLQQVRPLRRRYHRVKDSRPLRLRRVEGRLVHLPRLSARLFPDDERAPGGRRCRPAAIVIQGLPQLA